MSFINTPNSATIRQAFLNEVSAAQTDGDNDRIVAAMHLGVRSLMGDGVDYSAACHTLTDWAVEARLLSPELAPEAEVELEAATGNEDPNA